MKTQTHDPISELKDFVAIQAAEDAILAPDERRHQAKLVTDVLGQEPLKPSIINGLVNDYSKRVASLIGHNRIAT